MSEQARPPQQLAVALDYEVGTRKAPVVVAKGRGHVAEQIMAVARDNGVMIEANQMLAEALSGVPLDGSIPPELYQAVATVIGFVIRSQRKA